MQRRQTREEGRPTASTLHTEKDYTISGHLELMMDRDLSACVSQESVSASTSALSCSHASRLAGPSRPEKGPESEFVLKQARPLAACCHAPIEAALPPTLFLYMLYNSLTRR